jgi:putative flippase GtrA
MGTRTRRVFGEAIKFSAVNLVATAVAVLLFNALVHGLPMLYSPGPLHAYPVMTYLVANTVGMLISFYGNRGYAFKHRTPTGPAGGLANYAIVNFASFVIPMACLWVTRNVFDWSSVVADNVSANLVGAVLAMLFRFWAFRRFVFKRHVVEFRGAHGTKVLASLGPELGPDEAELLEHQPQQGEADPHDVVRVAGQARHEGSATSVDGEGARDR